MADITDPSNSKVSVFINTIKSPYTRLDTTQLEPSRGMSTRVEPVWNHINRAACCMFAYRMLHPTRSSADADNRLDAFSGQSRSTNMVPFHMLHIVSYCAIVTLSLSLIFVFKKFRDLEMGVKGHSRSLRVVSFDRLCMVSY